jgi:hypothetical protein
MTVDADLPSPDELRQFLRQELSRVSTASAGVTTTAVRSYLRFRAFEGERVERLMPIVASPASSVPSRPIFPLACAATRSCAAWSIWAFAAARPSR